MDKTINGTALEAPCWGFDVRGRTSCLSYDEAPAADAAFPPSEVGSVVCSRVVRGQPHCVGPDGAEPGAQTGLEAFDLISKVRHLQRERRRPRGPVHTRPIGTHNQALDCDVTGPNV